MLGLCFFRIFRPRGRWGTPFLAPKSDGVPHFWSIFGPILVPTWRHLGPLWRKLDFRGFPRGFFLENHHLGKPFFIENSIFHNFSSEGPKDSIPIFSAWLWMDWWGYAKRKELDFFFHFFDHFGPILTYF